MVDDALINLVIKEMGGWIALCHSKERSLPFLLQDFERRYSTYLIYPPPVTLKYLSSLSEKRPHHPVLFGEKEARLLILPTLSSEEEKSHG